MNIGTLVLVIVIALSFYIGLNWEELDLIRNSVNSVLDPTFGRILEFNHFLGFLIIVALLSFILTLAQRLFTNQKELKKLKEEQKAVREEIKKYKENPEKILELQRKELSIAPKMLHLTMRSVIYTGIPLILFFRWFQDVLSPIYGGWWIIYYIVSAVVFGSVFRKILKVS